MKLPDEHIALIIHEAHRAYQKTSPLHPTHVMPAPPWEVMTTWQKETVIGLVRLVRGDLQEGLFDLPPVLPLDVLNRMVQRQDDVLAARAHTLWLQRMKGKNWTWGEDKDPQKKTHPNLVPWEQLPEHEQAKTLQAVAIARVHI